MKSLTYIVTDKCNASCKFCAPNCGPRFSNHLSSSNMKFVFNKLKQKYQIPLIVFTGGEPLLYERDIYDVIKHVKNSESDTKIRIVTNAFWATNYKKAYELLEKLKNNGLTEINYSVDDFHQEFVPIEKIGFAVNAALDLKIPVLLAHKTYPGSISNKAFYEKLLGRKIPSIKCLTFNEIKKELLTISIGYTVPVGRCSDKINKLNWIPSEYINDSLYCEQSYKIPCTDVLNSYNISADGYLVPCCGLVDRELKMFYSLENVLQNDILQVMEKCSQSIIYNWLALEGPWAIKEFVKAKDKSVPFLEKYVQACQICQELFSNEKVLQIIYDNIDSVGKKLSILRSLFEVKRYNPHKPSVKKV